jgi:hypothetical protein
MAMSKYKKRVLWSAAVIAAVASAFVWNKLPGTNYVAPQCSTNQIDSVGRFYSVIWMLIMRSVVAASFAATCAIVVIAASALAAINWLKPFRRQPSQPKIKQKVVKTPIDKRFLSDMPTAQAGLLRRFIGSFVMQIVLDRTAQAIVIVIGAIIGLVMNCIWVSDHLCLASFGPKLAVFVISLIMCAAIAAAMIYVWSKLDKFNIKLIKLADWLFYNGYYLEPKTEGRNYRLYDFRENLLLNQVVNSGNEQSPDIQNELASRFLNALRKNKRTSHLNLARSIYQLSSSTRLDLTLIPNKNAATKASAIFTVIIKKSIIIVSASIGDYEHINQSVYAINPRASVTTLFPIVAEVVAISIDQAKEYIANKLNESVDFLDNDFARANQPISPYASLSRHKRKRR